MSYERWLRNKEIRDKRRQEQKERKNAPKVILHFVDELTDRTKTFEIPNYYRCGNLTDYLASFGFLAKSQYSHLYYSIRELQEYRPYVEIKDTCLCNGDTVHVEFADAAILKKSGATERFFKEYEVTIQWKITESRYYVRESSDRQCTETFLCHGYETKSGVEEMLRRKYEEADGYWEFRIGESYWPEYRIDAGGQLEHIKHLCQLNEQKKLLLFAEAEWREQDL